MTADEFKERLAAKDGRYARKFGLPGPPEVPRPEKAYARPTTSWPRGECVYFGSPVRPPAAPDTVRRWCVCEAGQGVVCPCRAYTPNPAARPDGLPPVNGCGGCPYYVGPDDPTQDDAVSADPGPTETVVQLGVAASLLAGPDPVPEPELSPVPAGWPNRAEVRNRHVAALKEMVSRTYAYPGGSGAGVLVCGGGPYWPGIYVLVKLLRDVGSDLPVQVWYRGDAEPVDEAAVAGLGVEFVDAAAAARDAGDARIMRGWEVKLYAITHTRFDTVLYIDADAYFVADPEPMVALARRHGFAFWNDLPGTAGNVKWPRVWPAGPAGVPQIQGGQLAIHRPLVWKQLCVAHWMNQHSDYFYSHMFGDQDTWRVAFAACGGPLASLGDAPWRHPAFVCPVGGRPTVVHRCRGKLFRPQDIHRGKTAYSNPAYHLPMEDAAFRHLADLLRREQAAAGPAPAFRAAYDNALWHQGGSGAGAEAAQAKPFADLLNALFAREGWTSIVDVGCGDGRAAAMYDAPVYTGVDVYPEAVRRLRQTNPGRAWVEADAVADFDSLPPADALVAKDVLHHWPNSAVRAFLHNAAASGKYKAVVLCQDVHQRYDGQDTYYAGYRALHPDMAPLNEFPLERLGTYLHKAVLVMWCKSG